MQKLSLEKISQMIDHTNLSADIQEVDLKKLCDEAVNYRFKMVAINSVQSKYCSILLKDTPVNTGAAIGFPLGQTSVQVKAFETEDAINNGANEIDYVINVAALKSKNYALIEQEMHTIVDICRTNNVISKVIFENCLLTEDEIIKISQISRKIMPDFIKTSTGFGAYGAKAEDVKLMKSVVGDLVKVKAAGGIRDLDTCIQMIKNGAERIGTSAGISIIEELTYQLNQEESDFILL